MLKWFINSEKKQIKSKNYEICYDVDTTHGGSEKLIRLHTFDHYVFLNIIFLYGLICKESLYQYNIQLDEIWNFVVVNFCIGDCEIF